MKNEKKNYTAPALEIDSTAGECVISTSFFLGDDHVIGKETNAAGEYEV